MPSSCNNTGDLSVFIAVFNLYLYLFEVSSGVRLGFGDEGEGVIFAGRGPEVIELTSVGWCS